MSTGPLGAKNSIHCHALIDTFFCKGQSPRERHVKFSPRFAQNIPMCSFIVRGVSKSAETTYFF